MLHELRSWLHTSYDFHQPTQPMRCKVSKLIWKVEQMEKSVKRKFDEEGWEHTVLTTLPNLRQNKRSHFFTVTTNQLGISELWLSANTCSTHICHNNTPPSQWLDDANGVLCFEINHLVFPFLSLNFGGKGFQNRTLSHGGNNGCLVIIKLIKAHQSLPYD